MKRIITLLLSFLCFLSIYAEEIVLPQDTIIKTTSTIITTDSITGHTVTTITETEKIVESKNDTESSSILYNGSSYNINFFWGSKKGKKNLSPSWTGIGMGFMNYNSDDTPLSALKMSTSHNFTFNLFTVDKQIGNHWLLLSGLGTEWSRYHFDTNAALTKKDGITFFEPAPQGITYKSTKLLSYYLTVPLLLEYQTGNFHISGGAVAFFKFYSKSQVKYYIEDEKHVEDKGKDLNMRPIDLRLRMQVGFNGFAVYGYYSPFSLFKTNKGPELNTYTIGLMIGI